MKQRIKRSVRTPRQTADVLRTWDTRVPAAPVAELQHSTASLQRTVGQIGDENGSVM